MTDSHDRPDDSEGSGLPPELEQVLRGLTGGGDLDPQMVEMMRSMGLADVDPQMLQMVAGQVQAMFAGADESGSVDVTVATDIARKTIAVEGDPSVSREVSSDARQAVDVANLWLDSVTDLDHSGLVGRAWSRAEWVEATMPVWRDLVDPIAVGVGDAMGAALTKQLGDLGEGGLPEGLVPPGTNPAAMMGQMAPMLRRMQGSMFSVQLGQAVGTLAGEVLTGGEVSLPLVPAPDVVLMPQAVTAFAEGLGIDEPQARLHLAVREAARTRLFHAVPWLGPQVLAAVRDHARDTTIDTDAIEEGLRSIDPTDAEAMQQALAGRLFAPQQSPAQKAALARLETLLALIEGWVDVVTAAAVSPHLPQAEALGEAIRRRRASGGPAEKTFAALVGLELRPRRLRDAANLFAALEASGGAEARDAAWAHPDVAPDAADLDDPLGYVERQRASGAGDDFDAELDAFLRGDTGSGEPGRGDCGGPTAS
ncbi:zinc-dependent metalloprotease [Knoellia sp. CPCC 206450]|uniref:zinc-dependent metalloprotease n=1 Tax=Knoellia tibetensis TaxID=3404798 RepID=UPI003B42BE99